jgi:hypothetical protein
MDEFSIEIPHDDDFYNALISSLSSDPSIEFRESRIADLVESEGNIPEILGYIINFKTAAALTLAMKYAAPTITAFIKKKHSITIETGGTKIKVSHPNDLEKAITAATVLSNRKSRPRSLKPKK